VGTGAHHDVGAHPVRLALGALQPKWRANALAWRSRYCPAAASAVASQLPLHRCFYSPLTWVKCPASLLRDGRFSCRFSGASTDFTPRASSARVVRCATTASAVASQLPLQWFSSSAFTSWASAARRRCCATATLSASPMQSLRQRTRAKGQEPKD
jgi:hypothetical protein